MQLIFDNEHAERALYNPATTALLETATTALLEHLKLPQALVIAGFMPGGELPAGMHMPDYLLTAAYGAAYEKVFVFPEDEGDKVWFTVWTDTDSARKVLAKLPHSSGAHVNFAAGDPFIVTATRT